MPDQVRHDEVGEIDLRAPEVYYIHNSPRRHPMRLAFLIPPMLLLAACGQGEDKKDATEIAINADGDDGGVQIKTGQNGGKLTIGGKDGTAVNINIPDFVDFDIEGDFDIDGVKLSPGSKITRVAIDASDTGGNDKEI